MAAIKGESSQLEIDTSIKEIQSSSTTSKKHSAFICEPLGDKDLISCPGIGPVTARKLEEIGIDKAYMLLGQFLLLRKDEQLFTEWLKELDVQTRHAKSCFQGLNEWCKTFM